MKKVLAIVSSPRGGESFSTRVALEFAQGIDNAAVTIRDLNREPLPHIDAQFIGAMFTPEEARTAEQRAALALSDELIAELAAADVVVVGAGMINFGVPSQLKAWIDHVTRRGITFRYGENGPIGLLSDKRTVLVLASAGVYSQGPMAAWDHVEPQLRTSLGFLGLDQIETVRIEGTAFGPEAADKALATARDRAALLAKAA